MIRNDLEALRKYCPEISEIISTPNADYSYRATVSHEAWGKALARIGAEIDYDNFKAVVAKRQGERRSIAPRTHTNVGQVS